MATCLPTHLQVILIQEQLSKNRIIIDTDSHGEVGAGAATCTWLE
jgi:hypothetical protein